MLPPFDSAADLGGPAHLVGVEKLRLAQLSFVKLVTTRPRFFSHAVVEAESMATAYPAARNLCAAATPHDGAQNTCTRTTTATSLGEY